MVLQAGSAQPVAAFDMADPAFAAGAVAREPALGSSGSGLLAARDERLLWLQRLEGLAAGANLEAAVERDLAGRDSKPLQLGDGIG
jgi:hypothetical protein